MLQPSKVAPQFTVVGASPSSVEAELVATALSGGERMRTVSLAVSGAHSFCALRVASCCGLIGRRLCCPGALALCPLALYATHLDTHAGSPTRRLAAVLLHELWSSMMICAVLGAALRFFNAQSAWTT